MAENNFYREKFFYIILLLLIGSFGWTTFVGWGLAQSISNTKDTGLALAKDTEAKAIALAKCNEDKATEMRKEYVARDETMIAEVVREFKEVNVALAEIKQDVKWIKSSRQDETKRR